MTTQQRSDYARVPRLPARRRPAGRRDGRAAFDPEPERLIDVGRLLDRIRAGA